MLDSLLVFLLDLLKALVACDTTTFLVIATFNEFVEIGCHFLQTLELLLKLDQLVVLLVVLLGIDYLSDRLLVRRQNLLGFDAWTLYLNLIDHSLLLL